MSKLPNFFASTPPPDRFRVRVTVARGGERIPLICGPDELPIFTPNAWLLRERRRSSVAFGTLQLVARVVASVYDWSTYKGMDLEQRMFRGKWLTLSEQSSLRDWLTSWRRDFHPAKITSLKSLRELKTLEGSMKREPSDAVRQVSTNVGSYRMVVAAEYLAWLGDKHFHAFLEDDEAKAKENLDAMVLKLKKSVTRSKNRNKLYARQGPGQEAINQLLDIVKPQIHGNPWRNADLQIRNELMINMYFQLGIRRSELLGIKTDAIDFYAKQIHIDRLPDDPDDPRGAYQPLAKTNDRILPMNSGLEKMIYHYVSEVRTKVKDADDYDFLFIDHQTGRPLVPSTINKLFQALRKRVATLPKNLTAHLLRHAHHDEISLLGKELGISNEDLEEIRMQDAGWNSRQTATIYTRNAVRHRSDEISLKLQEKTMNRDKKESE